MIKAEIYRVRCSRRLYLSFFLIVMGICVCNISDILDQSEFVTVTYIFDMVTLQGWFRELIFVLSAWPFAISYCEDCEHQFRKSIRVRTSEIHYAVSKAMVVMIGTFGFVVIACVTACVILSFRFPLTESQIGMQENWTGAYGLFLTGRNPILFLLIRIILFALGTVVFAMLSLAISSIRPDYYITICAPFVSSFICKRLDQILPGYFSIQACLSGELIFENAGLQINFGYSVLFLMMVSIFIGVFFLYTLHRQRC